MTIIVGYHYPSPKLRKFVKSLSTNSFLDLKKLTDREYAGVIEYPKINSFEPLSSVYLPVAMHGPNFPPHIDPCLINIKKGQDWRGFFWVTETQEDNHWVHLQVGNEEVSLRNYQWAVFDARKVHSAQSNKKWFGISAQIASIQK